MIKKILIVNPFGIGDVLFSMHVVQALKNALPQVRLGFLGNERTIELLKMNRSIDVCHTFNRDELRAFRRRSPGAFLSRILQYVRQIRREHYDVLLDLSLGREFSFVAFCLGIPKRIGFDYRGRGFFLTHKTGFTGYESKHVVDWQLSLLKHLDVKIPSGPFELSLEVSSPAARRAAARLKTLGFSGTDYFAVAPGGGRSWGENAVFKQWAPERFAEVGNAWASRHAAGVLLLGDSEERSLLEQVRLGLSAPCAVACDEPLESVCAMLKQARFLLCNDGGLLHLANALGVKTVSIYGPVDETCYGPYGKGAAHQVLTEPVPCRPCYRQFHFPPCAHRRRCLEELSVEKVLVAVEKIS